MRFIDRLNRFAYLFYRNSNGTFQLHYTIVLSVAECYIKVVKTRIIKGIIQLTANAQALQTSNTDPVQGKRFYLIFISLVLAMFVASLSETVASTALPTIAGDLKGMEIMQWITTAYILTSSVTMPIFGRLSDMRGRKKLLIWSIVIYAAGKVLCAVASDMGVLIAGRCISGVGGGGIPILAQSCMTDLVPPRKLGTYVGISGAVLTLSLVIGPIFGGWLVEAAGWRWIFWFSVPLVTISVIPIAAFLRKSQNANPGKTDVAGIVFLSSGTSAFVLITALSGGTIAWTDPANIALLAVFIASLILFIHFEKRAKEPIIPMTLFKNRNFDICSAVGLLINIGIMGALTYLPTYYQLVKNMSPMTSGLIFAPMAIGSLITSTLSGILATKYGKYKWMGLVMGASCAIGFYLLYTLRPSTPDWVSIVYLVILGAGLGIGLHILTLVVQNEFPHKIVGTATGANRYFRQIGSTLGASIVGALFTSCLTTDLANKLPKADHLTLSTITPAAVDKLPEATRELIAKGYSEALVPLFIIFVPVAAACFVLMLFLKNNRLATTIDHGAAVSAGTKPSK